MRKSKKNNYFKAIIIVQARASSKRFPDKVLKKIKNKSLIEILIKRLKKSKNRPILEKEKSNDSIKKIYFIRKKFYNKAHYRIKCKALTLKQIIEKILNFYEKSRN